MNRNGRTIEARENALRNILRWKKHSVDIMFYRTNVFSHKNRINLIKYTQDRNPNLPDAILSPDVLMQADVHDDPEILNGDVTLNIK